MGQFPDAGDTERRCKSQTLSLSVYSAECKIHSTHQSGGPGRRSGEQRELGGAVGMVNVTAETSGRERALRGSGPLGHVYGRSDVRRAEGLLHLSTWGSLVILMWSVYGEN